MYNFYAWFATSPLASAIRTFVAIVLFSMVNEFARLGAFDVSKWETWCIAGLVAAVPPILRWLNPADTLITNQSKLL